MEIRLGKNEVMTFGGDARQLSVSCHRGELWLTQQGDSNDYLIQPGQHFTVNRKGRVVMLALSPSELRLDSERCKRGKAPKNRGALFQYGKLHFNKRWIWRGLIGQSRL